MVQFVKAQPDYLATINKYGRTLNAANGVLRDLWSRDVQPIWLPPLAARIHDIASSDVNDTSGGTGLQQLRAYYLPDWTTAEASEVVTMNGTTNVPMANAAVIIHRLEPVAWGSAGPNVGTITATAQTDGSVTAQIEPDQGQTQMAIYGIPTGKALSIRRAWVKLLEGNNAIVDAWLRVNTIPDVEQLGYVTKEQWGVNTDLRFVPLDYEPFKRVAGPAIVKIQIESDTNNMGVVGGFNGYVHDSDVYAIP